MSGVAERNVHLSQRGVMSRKVAKEQMKTIFRIECCTHRIAYTVYAVTYSTNNLYLYAYKICNIHIVYKYVWLIINTQTYFILSYHSYDYTKSKYYFSTWIYTYTVLYMMMTTLSFCSFFFVILMMSKSPQQGCFPAKLPLTTNKIKYINNEALLSKICCMGITYQEIRIKS